ncbi:MAG TPA: polyprenyl synthetase family protein [Acidimicrobiales bacterium]
MDPAPSPDRPPSLGPDQFARLFGIPDLADRLAAVDDCIARELARDDAVLGPASLRMAATGGKRLRPLLTIVAAALGDRFDERVVAAAAAVELVQVGSLVHDDILDQAATRRGKPTINAVEGLDHAVLAGDYILARAGELAASVSQEAAAALAATLGALCEGQALEMRDAFDPDRAVESHLRSIHGKTAALFACACRMGALAADVSERNTTALARYGEAFGMAFQVLDDVLDLIGDAERLGKPTGIDIASGVYTLPVITALNGPHGAELRRLLPGPSPEPRDGDGASGDGPVARAVALVRDTGCVPVALEAMDRYADEARRAIAHLDQTTIGDGLIAFPRTYMTWALETFMDPRYLEVPLTAIG